MLNFRILPSKARSLKILPPCAVAVQNILDSLPVCEYSLSFGQNVADLILKLLHQHSGSTTFYLRFHSVPNNSTKEKFTYMLSTKWNDCNQWSLKGESIFLKIGLLIRFPCSLATCFYTFSLVSFFHFSLGTLAVWVDISVVRNRGVRGIEIVLSKIQIVW